MKISVTNLQKAYDLSSQRLYLHDERKKLATPAPVTLANAKVVFQGATMKQAVTVEIEEHRGGAIGAAIIAFIRANFDERIAKLDAQLAELGIEVEGIAA